MRFEIAESLVSFAFNSEISQQSFLDTYTSFKLIISGSNLKFHFMMGPYCSNILPVTRKKK